MQPARARAGELVAGAPLDNGDVHAAERELAREHFTVRAQSRCDIWIDGKQVAKKTPAMEFRIPAGEHDVEFRTPTFDEKAKIEMSPDATMALFADDAKKTVRKL